MLRGVADVNVFVSAALVPLGPSGRILAAALEGRWQLVVSRSLLDEVRTVFSYPRILRRRPVEETNVFVSELAVIAEHVPDAPQPWSVVTRDPKDDHLVALAQSARVDFLVSGDVHPTELAGLVPRVVRPADFLAMIGERT